ncbi:MAG TPA: rhomboid family intramembrane serine protease [Thermoanaerobaculia bacterium]|nr:rhomboid family intramembrane serine protease [Thermoanaerobaculia bacterium]
MTILIIVVNVLAFLWELSLGPYLQKAILNIAFIPRRFWMPGYLVPNVETIFISMFLHGGFLHIGGNMLYLWIFGDNIEDRLGHARFAIFYFLCGALAALTHAFANPSSAMPAIGASGAIAGVLGAYLILFPRARVTTVIPIFFFLMVREIPAVILLVFWFVLQLFSGVGSLAVSTAEETGGVAYFAHIGGFVAGMILIVLMGGTRPRRPQAVYSYDGWR